MSSTDTAEENDELTAVVSESSKREYLLAQIRQKDMIIESLLKQVRRFRLLPCVP